MSFSVNQNSYGSSASNRISGIIWRRNENISVKQSATATHGVASNHIPGISTIGSHRVNHVDVDQFADGARGASNFVRLSRNELSHENIKQVAIAGTAHIVANADNTADEGNFDPASLRVSQTGVATGVATNRLTRSTITGATDIEQIAVGDRGALNVATIRDARGSVNAVQMAESEHGNATNVFTITA